MPLPMFSIFSWSTYAVVWLRKQLSDQSWSTFASAAAFIIFIASTFFIPGHAVPVIMIILTALMAFHSGAAAETFRKNTWLWGCWAFFGAWMILGIAVAGPEYKISDFFNLVLLVAFSLSVAQVSRALSTRQILSILAIAGGASAFASLVLHIVSGGDFFDRLEPLGRGRNPIPGAGGFAIALIALAALWFERIPGRRPAPLGIALTATLLLALACTQSRAPTISLGLALLLALWLNKRGGTAAILAACGGAWLMIAGLGILEPTIKALICGSDADWCRPAYRSEIWGWVRDQIALHPMLGTGPSFRFQKVWMSHPHNGLFGIAMYYGLPALAAFWIMIGFQARALARQSNRSLRFFGLASLIFSFGYMGTDLPNPFAFFHMHYLFLWLPFFLVLASGQATAQDGGEIAFSGSDGFRRI